MRNGRSTTELHARWPRPTLRTCTQDHEPKTFKKVNADGGRTRNLRIRNPTRFHCATTSPRNAAKARQCSKADEAQTEAAWAQNSLKRPLLLFALQNMPRTILIRLNGRSFPTSSDERLNDIRGISPLSSTRGLGAMGTRRSFAGQKALAPTRKT
ncbi:hypothetical protein TRVL_08200 [Trypanosoma vivax]|nr:hypothetical protein TRVL_08200 [Trypanosoma vivax]